MIAEDEEMGVYILVKTVDMSLTEPFPKLIKHDGKTFKFLYFAHAIAEEVWGNDSVRGTGEKFWDYMSDDGSYLSLGISDESNEKVDFYGKTVDKKNVSIK